MYYLNFSHLNLSKHTTRFAEAKHYVTTVPYLVFATNCLLKANRSAVFNIFATKTLDLGFQSIVKLLEKEKEGLKAIRIVFLG